MEPGAIGSNADLGLNQTEALAVPIKPAAVEAPPAQEVRNYDFLEPVVELLSIEDLSVETKAQIVRGLLEAQNVLKKWPSGEAKPLQRFGIVGYEAAPASAIQPQEIYSHLVEYLVESHYLTYQGDEAFQDREKIGMQLIPRPDLQRRPDTKAADSGQREQIDRIVNHVSKGEFATATNLGMPEEGYAHRDIVDLYEPIRKKVGVSGNFHGGWYAPQHLEAVTGSAQLGNGLVLRADIWEYNEFAGSLSRYHKVSDPGLSLMVGQQDVEALLAGPNVVEDLASRNIPGFDEIMHSLHETSAPEENQRINTQAPFELI